MDVRVSFTMPMPEGLTCEHLHHLIASQLGQVADLQVTRPAYQEEGRYLLSAEERVLTPHDDH